MPVLQTSCSSTCTAGSEVQLHLQYSTKSDSQLEGDALVLEIAMYHL
eukprot:CAMPEP_0117682018 /NCGR_PEP_ID=MMETSP0804-20121206/19367_1 /TAXON_ID=1074897 /ORGANISM="Tetraselmis astigmatica, Strain CCMP880" /LENGTH=46 /DNA_ID= /DNA_START= /DNA_END= /DNA_ORIENTATION=